MPDRIKVAAKRVRCFRRLVALSSSSASIGWGVGSRKIFCRRMHLTNSNSNGRYLKNYEENVRYQYLEITDDVPLRFLGVIRPNM
jgi:hypothetical protein